MNMGIVKVNDFKILIIRDLEGVEHPSNLKVSIGSSGLDDIDREKYAQ